MYRAPNNVQEVEKKYAHVEGMLAGDRDTVRIVL